MNFNSDLIFFRINSFIRQFNGWQIKMFLSIFGLAIIVSVIYYTQSVVNQLIEREQRIIKSYTNIHSRIINNDTFDETSYFFLNEITPNITFPMISTDKNDIPNYPYENWTLNIQLDSNLTSKEQKKYIENYVKQMKKEYSPIVLRDKNGNIIQKFYYTNSQFINFLKYFPYIGIIIISGFLLISYIAILNIKKNEESNVWVGMSKEAAHQLGTPLSSIMAWLEILKFQAEESGLFDEKFNNNLKEIDNDINRLSIIANRFGKIGSKPKLVKMDISIILNNVCDYFDRRLPHIGKKIEIKRNFENNIFVSVNEDLFNWVVENLIKNAAEAIDTKFGVISIESQIISNKIILNFTDNGRGMTSKVKKRLFNPGFTTKRRGWGLGLTLTRRIVEEYHKGRIFVKDTQINKGTIFQIELPHYYS